MNVFNVSGRLTKDGEYKKVSSGDFVYVNTIAVPHPEQYKEKDKDLGVLFIDFAVWGEARAKFLNEALEKGQEVFVSGTLCPNYYTTRDGFEKMGLVLKYANVYPGRKKGENTKSEDQVVKNRKSIGEVAKQTKFNQTQMVDLDDEVDENLPF